MFHEIKPERAYQEIVINKKELIRIIQSTAPFSEPKVEFEQYSIDAVSAADIIYFAGFEFDDIANHLIIDLGSGTGRLSIAARQGSSKAGWRCVNG